jgi:hypothetical protein
MHLHHTPKSYHGRFKTSNRVEDLNVYVDGRLSILTLTEQIKGNTARMHLQFEVKMAWFDSLTVPARG